MKTVEEIIEQMDAIVAGADTETRALNDEEVVQYEALEGELKSVKRSGDVRSRHAAYHTPVTDPVHTATVETDDTQERAFEAYLRTGQRSMELVEARAQGTAPDSAGGYLVPPGFRQKIVERLVAFGGFMNAAETITTESGNPIQWPTIDDTANSGEIVAEHGTGAAGADLVFGEGTLGAYKYMSFGASNLPLRVSVELLQDSAFDVVGLVSRLLGKRIARAMAVDMVTGDGSGEPKGIIDVAADIELATGNAMTYAKMLDIVHGVDPEYRDGAKWAFNDATLRVFRGLEDANDRPLWLPSTGSLADALPGGTLAGYPVVIDQAFPDIADSTGAEGEAFAVFGDLAEAYVVRRVKDIQLVVDPYGRAANGEVQFTAWARADGTIQNRNAYVAVAGFNAP